MTAAPAGLDRADAMRQSLATGDAGVALAAIEPALAGAAPWSTAHAWIRRLAAGAVDGGDHAGLFYGLPAVAFVLHCAALADPRYRPAVATLDPPLLALTRRRLAAARIRRGEAATFAEYDLFYGLIGVAALLLHRAPDSDALSDLLDYLVTLAEPRRHHGVWVPGWWVEHDPDPTLPTPGGHANLGMAHGAAGILALLALAARRGRVVAHHIEAIHRLTDWFDRWCQPDDTGGIWWPQWLTHDDLSAGRLRQTGPGRPSWCYGTPGIGRALQLAAIATDDPARQADAEQVLAACATSRHLEQLTEPGLCHGLAGLYQTLHRAAADATTTVIAERLKTLAASIIDRAAALTRSPGHGPDPQDGLLTGGGGVLLAASTARHGTPRTGWDACLLIT
jgi:lantibiotic biosynthesis protein